MISDVGLENLEAVLAKDTRLKTIDVKFEFINNKWF